MFKFINVKLLNVDSKEYFSIPSLIKKIMWTQYCEVRRLILLLTFKKVVPCIKKVYKVYVKVFLVIYTNSLSILIDLSVMKVQLTETLRFLNYFFRMKHMAKKPYWIKNKGKKLQCWLFVLIRRSFYAQEFNQQWN